MKPLFPLKSHRVHPLSPRALLAFDFDGTLAPIRRDPDDARMPDPTASLLLELAAHGPVAILSGRSRADLRMRVGDRPFYMIGNHGLEDPSTPAAALKLAARTCARWKSQLVSVPGTWIEDKRYSLSLHFRRCSDPVRARRQLLAGLKPLDPEPRIVGGKRVLNLLPLTSPHKGQALTHAMIRLRKQRALYVGDDETDEDVFRLGDPRILGIRVGRSVASKARYFLRSQREIDRVLEELLRLATNRPARDRSDSRPGARRWSFVSRRHQCP